MARTFEVLFTCRRCRFEGIATVSARGDAPPETEEDARTEQRHHEALAALLIVCPHCAYRSRGAVLDFVTRPAVVFTSFLAAALPLIWWSTSLAPIVSLSLYSYQFVKGKGRPRESPRDFVLGVRPRPELPVAIVRR